MTKDDWMREIGTFGGFGECCQGIGIQEGGAKARALPTRWGNREEPPSGVAVGYGHKTSWRLQFLKGVGVIT